MPGSILSLFLLVYIMLRSPQCGSRALISCLLSTTKAGKEHVANYQEKLVKLVWDDDVETGVQTGDACKVKGCPKNSA